MSKMNWAKVERERRDARGKRQESQVARPSKELMDKWNKILKEDKRKGNG